MRSRRLSCAVRFLHRLIASSMSLPAAIESVTVYFVVFRAVLARIHDVDTVELIVDSKSLSMYSGIVAVSMTSGTPMPLSSDSSATFGRQLCADGEMALVHEDLPKQAVRTHPADVVEEAAGQSIRADEHYRSRVFHPVSPLQAIDAQCSRVADGVIH